jgi:diacylglycerol kinase
MQPLIDQIMNEDSTLNKIARGIIAGAVIILTVMVIVKFMTGQWAL